jgi:trans-2,3-dihydro-3-hydroxyanthranilate isomerase
MHEYLIINAFADDLLSGNPVAVFLDGDDLSGDTMQAIARQLNLSETTFVSRARGQGDWHVRIFTPVNELPFAGHPLLGTALALGRRANRSSLTLATAMGLIPFALSDGDDGSTEVRMDQPVPRWEPFARTGELLAALGLPSSTLPVEIYRNGPRHVFVGLESVAELSRLRPDHRALAAFEDLAVNCVAPSGTGWRSRMFSPAYGVVEDAATGSAAGPLAIHLARHGLSSFGTDIEIIQGVEIGRPSRMNARAEGTGAEVRRVQVWGDALVFATCVTSL